MIIYQNSKKQFEADILTNDIANIILRNLQEKTNKSVGKSEFTSWQNSLEKMGTVVNDGEIPSDSMITIEYHLPQSSKRVDFIISGRGIQQNDCAVLIELKQWEEVHKTEKDGVVVTRFKGGLQETTHPSYQAWSYKALLEGFNQAVQDKNINLVPCAYLHNCYEDKVIRDSFYDYYTQMAPVFLKSDAVKLRTFIKTHIVSGDVSNVMKTIEEGKLRPSKVLADKISSMLKGNPEFVMIDEQKVIYEKALSLTKKNTSNKKNVLIVKGGPGTGKSVVAINLLVATTKAGLLAQYVTKNSAPRDVYRSKLTGDFRKSEINHFFSGSGSYHSSEPNKYDVLIVDEAHRLNEKSGMFKNIGENQIKEIIGASRLSVFFIDEEQMVTFDDIGQVSEIVKWANFYRANVEITELSSQFRCNGSDGYLSWLDNTLEIKETANITLEDINYDFRVVDTPDELKELIYKKNQEKNSARIAAGYCWDWKSKNSPEVNDITIGDFSMKWNLASDGMLWIIKPESVNEVGCIHTTQGLEIEYVGVIIGDDLTYENGIVTNPFARARTDKSLNGFKKLYKTHKKDAMSKADNIIKNTYRTLMTRGSKGCYIYCTNDKLADYFKKYSMRVAIDC